MASREEKKHRQELVRKLRQEERTRAEAKCPFPSPTSKGFYDYVNASVGEKGCDRSLAATIRFLHERNLPSVPVVQWLNEHGGGCDCEVIANVEDKWGEIVGSI